MLQRFLDAQSQIYDDVVRELSSGKKTSCWMWYIFPQERGLGSSPTSIYYGIVDKEEARAYLDHPVLGPRLLECVDIVIGLEEGRTLYEIFGHPDDIKFTSCMQLFAASAQTLEVRDKFVRALQRP